MSAAAQPLPKPCSFCSGQGLVERMCAARQYRNKDAPGYTCKEGHASPVHWNSCRTKVPKQCPRCLGTGEGKQRGAVLRQIITGEIVEERARPKRTRRKNEIEDEQRKPSPIYGRTYRVDLRQSDPFDCRSCGQTVARLFAHDAVSCRVCANQRYVYASDRETLDER